MSKFSIVYGLNGTKSTAHKRSLKNINNSMIFTSTYNFSYLILMLLFIMIRHYYFSIFMSRFII